MSAKHVSGQEYEYVFNHEADWPTFHKHDCPAKAGYTSDMTESAAIRAYLDGEMHDCSVCCGDFPLEVIGQGEIPTEIEAGGSINIWVNLVQIKDDVDLSKPARRTLEDRGFFD